MTTQSSSSKIINPKHLKIVRVKLANIKRIWQIRNHPLVRKYSGQSAKIEFKNSQPWFSHKYFSRPVINFCYLLKYNELVIGYCRFDLHKPQKKYDISIALDPLYHGLGLGSMLLAKSLKKFTLNKKRRFAKIHAEIQKRNPASLKLFKKHNFKIYKSDAINYYLKYFCQ